MELSESDLNIFNFNHVYGDELKLPPSAYDDDSSDDSEDDEDEYHILDEEPVSFLQLSNSVRFDMQCSDSLVIPTIPRRCLTSWSIGKKLARGRGAVVFDMHCNKNGVCTKVARISQFRTKKEKNSFVRDVSTRFLLQCRCPDVVITQLLDAFICTTSTKEYGVTVTDKYPSTALHGMLNLTTLADMQDYIELVREQLTDIMDNMHRCGFVHRDVHQGNVLMRKRDGRIEFVLTDFESSAGTPFKTSERVLDAYIASDNTGVETILAELESVLDYVSGQDNEFDFELFEEYDITQERLNTLKNSLH